MRTSPRLPLVHALLWIVGSMFVVATLAHFSLQYYKDYHFQKAHNPDYAILYILQTGPQREALKTTYLAELLNLSIDRAPSSIDFDGQVAEKTLRASPLIEGARVKVLGPDTLYIDYTVRQPVALLYDYQNVAIDREGYPIPFTPFFTPKNLPEIYIGLPDRGASNEHLEGSPIRWGTPLKGKSTQLALNLLNLFDSPALRDLFTVKRIDVSHAFSDSYGTREIVLLTEDVVIQRQGQKEIRAIFPKILRLSTKKYLQELGNYLKLREKLLEEDRKRLCAQGDSQRMRAQEKIIDLRIENLAFISPE